MWCRSVLEGSDATDMWLRRLQLLQSSGCWVVKLFHIHFLQCKYVGYIFSSFTSSWMLSSLMSSSLMVFFPSVVKEQKASRKTAIGWSKVVFSRGACSGELQAAVSLSDALGLQLCGVNSHKTSLCSQKMRACRVRPCTYTCSAGNNTFIPYDALGSHLPMFLATNRPRGAPRNTAHRRTDAKKPAVNQLWSEVQTCIRRYTNGILNVRFSSRQNAQFDICIKGMCGVLHKSEKGNVHYWD